MELQTSDKKNEEYTKRDVKKCHRKTDVYISFYDVDGCGAISISRRESYSLIPSFFTNIELYITYV